MIGQIVSTFAGVMHGPLCYKDLQSDKSQGLKNKGGNFEAYVSLSKGVSQEFKWWIDNTETAYNVGTSHSHSCNYMAKKIWQWCIKRAIWISVAHTQSLVQTQ